MRNHTRTAGAPLVLALLVLSLLVGPVAAESVTVSYERSEAQDLYDAATYLGQSPDWVQRFGLEAAWFVTVIGRTPAQDFSWIATDTGPYPVTSDVTGDTLAALNGLRAHYNLEARQAVRLGATFVVFLAGRDAVAKGLPWPSVPLPPLPASTTTTPPTTTLPPDPGPQCTTWPKDEACWPQRDVAGTADAAFWSSHPCVVARAAVDAGDESPLPVGCVTIPPGTVADPATVSWPVPKVRTWAAYWTRWGNPLETVVPELVREAVTTTHLGAGSWLVEADCDRVDRAAELIDSARRDAARSGDRPWPQDVTAELALVEEQCRNVVTGVRLASPDLPPADARTYRISVQDGFEREWFNATVTFCAAPWNRAEAGDPDVCGGPLPPLPF